MGCRAGKKTCRLRQCVSGPAKHAPGRALGFHKFTEMCQSHFISKPIKIKLMALIKVIAILLDSSFRAGWGCVLWINLMLCLEPIYTGVSGPSVGFRWRWHFFKHLGIEEEAAWKDGMIRTSHCAKEVDTGALACSEMLWSGPSTTPRVLMAASLYFIRENKHLWKCSFCCHGRKNILEKPVFLE
jgi:hypothetical protein